MAVHKSLSVIQPGCCRVELGQLQQQAFTEIARAHAHGIKLLNFSQNRLDVFNRWLLIRCQ